MSSTSLHQANRNKTTIIIFLLVAALLNIMPMGVYAGVLLSLMILATLLRAEDDDVVNRRVLIGTALLVLMVNIAFLLGYMRLYE
ncbi:MAG TPA: hypothetical protein VNP95_13180 [Thermomicrobiales bacterium]|nr:hypothetical protein [Thermomicrobiales bacterium]